MIERRAIATLAVIAGCSGSAQQAPAPQPQVQGHYVELGLVVEEPGAPPGSPEPIVEEARPMPARPLARPERSGTLAPSKPLKAYKGPEGALIVMVEVDDGKQMLVHFRNIDRELDGKTLLYALEDLGDGHKNVYVNKKRGSKTYRSTMLIARHGAWEFFHPFKSGVHFRIGYSESESRQIDLDDVLTTYNP